MARLNLTLLGGFQGRVGAPALLALPTRKAQALLAFLSLPPGRSHPREKLASLLWGGVPEPQAKKGLRQALFELRKAVTVDPPPLLTDGDTVALNPRSQGHTQTEPFAPAEQRPNAGLHGAHVPFGEVVPIGV